MRGKTVVAIRINAIDSGLADRRYRADVSLPPRRLCAAQGERRGRDTRACPAQLAGLEAQAGAQVGSTAVVPIVTEHPRAIPRLESLCSADPRVIAIMCGNEDLAAAIGARRVKDESGRCSKYSAIVRALALLAGSAAGIGVVDSPVVELAATDVLQRESAEAAAMGYTGKLRDPSGAGRTDQCGVPADRASKSSRRNRCSRRRKGTTARFVSRTGWSTSHMCAAPSGSWRWHARTAGVTSRQGRAYRRAGADAGA